MRAPESVILRREPEVRDRIGSGLVLRLQVPSARIGAFGAAVPLAAGVLPRGKVCRLSDAAMFPASVPDRRMRIFCHNQPWLSCTDKPGACGDAKKPPEREACSARQTAQRYVARDVVPYAGITQIRFKGQYLSGIQSQPANSSPPGVCGFRINPYYSKILADVQRDSQRNSR